MALDLTGIQNVEFYSGHYLDAVLEGDLKSVLDTWTEAKKEHGTRTPWEDLGAVSAAYFKAAKNAEGESNAAERWRIARELHPHLLKALGYEYSPDVEPLDGDEVCPVLLSLQRDGNPFLWVVDTGFPEKEDDDPLDSRLLEEQLPSVAADASIPQSTWRQLLDERLFRIASPPRWVLFLAGSTAWLIERGKWPQGKYLRFELGELFARKQTSALKATAGLLHKDVLAPDAGLCLHDTLDENSHKHAYSVSSDLKHGVRRAVELLANEAVYYRREVQKQGVFNEEELSPKLTAECLNWMYRLLFLFFVEARGGELEIVPMGADAYREGYSLEKLREFELVPLESDRARSGYFIHDSLKLLFGIINEGFAAERGQELELLESQTVHGSMVVSPLRSPLFDDDRLEVLKNVRFRNDVLQKVLQLLSLSAEKKKKPRGRISYAQLGINQLGAVYEGLLSYTGFFATEDLYEVASEKDCEQLSGKPAAEREALKTYFVPASRIGDYKEGEIVKDDNERKVVHKKGIFIFRLAGRNREKSASYYTPEVLTQCLVKYALKELLWEEGEEGAKPTPKKTADEILALTICEPAMGSSAFLIEAVDQLADAYLEARQKERGETIPPERYQREKRRVKARLATNNCYGVDLNPTAVELAKVSLWLATLHEKGKCPWFGLRLASGNSLVGARREVFKTVDVTRKGTKDDPNWLSLVPEPVPLHHGEDAPPPDEVDWANWTAPPRPKGTIYHFLLPAEGMAAFDKDKVIKQLAPESVKRIKEWRKEFCKPFNKKDAERLEQISDAVDRLFAQVVRERALATRETSDRIPVWGEADYEERSAQQADLLVRDQEDVAASLEDGSSAYRRLKLAMDAWCALWFWPIEETGLLPDRAAWLAQTELILKGQVTHEPIYQQAELFSALTPASSGEGAGSESSSGDALLHAAANADRLKRLRALSDAFRGRRAEYIDHCGLVEVDRVLERDESLAAAQDIADRFQFHHWHLRFAEIFAQRGGFDLTLGNPPWIKVQWNESAVLADDDPMLALRSSSAANVAARRTHLLEAPNMRLLYLEEFASSSGLQTYLNAGVNFAILRGIQTNLYKCFIVHGLRLSGDEGLVAILHQKGIYDDANGGLLRGELSARLSLLLHFSNKLKLFPEIKDEKHYEISFLKGALSKSVAFTLVSNLFHPRTLDESVNHDGRGSVPVIKDEQGQWNLGGHRKRLVSVDLQRLRLFSVLFDAPGTPAEETRIPVVHNEDVVAVLDRLSHHHRHLEDWRGQYFPTEMWHETYAEEDGTIGGASVVPKRVSELIVQGTHFFVGNPLYKTPNPNCSHNQDYTAIDLLSVPPDYLPRTNYVPACDRDSYLERVPTWEGSRITGKYRVVARKMMAQNGERTLVSCVMPPEVAHINSCFSLTMGRNRVLITAAVFASIVLDFLVKSTGKTNFQDGVARTLPVVERGVVHDLLVARALQLNCLTAPYRELWEAWDTLEAADAGGAVADRRTKQLVSRNRTWSPDCALRSELERRLALVEIDVLAAMGFALSLEQLISIYRVQFPVLQEYERERLYDQYGRIVPKSKTVAGNPAVSLVELAATLKEQAGFDVDAEYHPDGSNTQELRKQPIKLGKKEADVLGVSERCTMVDLLAETEVRWSDEDHPEGRPVRLVGLRYTDPGLEPRMERVYPTPWTRCDREADYRQAWAEFERRLGEKMPQGRPR